MIYFIPDECTWPHLVLRMIRNRLSGNPKLPELKLEGQQLAGTFYGSPRQHILLEAALSVQKGRPTGGSLKIFSSITSLQLSTML